MNKRLKKKKSFEDYLGRSEAWQHVVSNSNFVFKIYEVFKLYDVLGVWKADDVMIWRGYLYRNFRPENLENNVRYRKATMYHYIDKRVRKQYKKLRLMFAEIRSHYMLLSAKHIIGVSDSCEGMYLDD